MITVEEHLSRCLAAVGPLPVDLPLLDALGHVLAGDATSAVELPGFDNSPMDGFALRAADVAGAGADAPTRLAVSGEVAAGGGRPERLAPGTAVRIMTGAPLPDGADSVVPVEWTGGWTDGDAAAGVVAVRQAPDAGAFVRRAGEDVARGEVVVAAGTVLTARHLSLLAATGHAALAVHRAPRVAVLSSGSELVPPGRPLASGRCTTATATGCGRRRDAGRDRYLGIVPDDAAACGPRGRGRRRRRPAAHQRRRQRGRLRRRQGGAHRAGRRAVRPRRHAARDAAGLRHDRWDPVLTLPGNPVSSMVSFEVFVRPVLRALAGVPVPAQRREVIATRRGGWSSPAGGGSSSAASSSPGERAPVVAPVGAQGSHLVADLAARDLSRRGPRGRHPGRRPATSCGACRWRAPRERAHPPRRARQARMVDVSAKAVTVREASAARAGAAAAAGRRAAARRAACPRATPSPSHGSPGIQAAKRTPDLVPLAHPVAVHAVAVELAVADDGVDIGPPCGPPTAPASRWRP